MNGKILTHQELVDHLEDVSILIERGVSQEGTVSWTRLSDDAYDVVMFVRYTDTSGRDDVQVIGELEV